MSGGNVLVKLTAEEPSVGVHKTCIIFALRWIIEALPICVKFDETRSNKEQGDMTR